MKRYWKVILAVLIVAAVIGGGAKFWMSRAPTSQEGRLKTALNLKTLPASIEKLHCPPSEAVTYVVIKCTFTIEASDFNTMISGRQFKESLTDLFEAQNMDFERGGDITLHRKVLESTSKYFIELNYYQQ